MTSTTVLWIYVGLLVLGGGMGYLKAKSKVSLITSSVFAIGIALCLLAVIPYAVIDYLLGVLILVFGIRLAKTKKFMPAGMLLLLTALTLLLKYVLPVG